MGDWASQERGNTAPCTHACFLTRQPLTLASAVGSACAVATPSGKKFFRYNLSPTITIMLPSDWCMIGYKFRKLKKPQTINVFNHAMLYGKFTFKQLVGKPFGTVFKTAYTGRTMRKVPSRGNSVQLRVGSVIKGPRTPCECLALINDPDLYVGPTVTVQGTNCLLTPADYLGGPFGRPGVPGSGNDP